MAQVSVIIPCFNAASWLPATLRSVTAQRGVDLDIVVVDDGSTDGSSEVVREVCPAARLIRTDNYGASAARNRGTAEARGSFLQYLDADDILASNKLTQQVDALERSGADVAYGDWQRLVEHNPGEYSNGEVVRREMEGPPDIALFTWFWSPPAAYLFRRGIVEAVGSWNCNLPIIQDARFALDCALRGARFVYCPGLMAFYREHTTNSLSRRDQPAFVRDCLINALEVKQCWEERQPLSDSRRGALAEVLHYVATASCGKDAKTFDTACAALGEVAGRYTPMNGRNLSKMVFQLLGYRRAVKFLFFCRSHVRRRRPQAGGGAPHNPLR